MSIKRVRDAGVSPTASVVIYDAEADTWATGPPIPSPCKNCLAVTIDGGILLNSDGVTFHYKNGVWAEVAGVDMGGATCGYMGGATCGLVLLG